MEWDRGGVEERGALTPPDAARCHIYANIQRAGCASAREWNITEAILTDAEAIIDTCWKIDLNFLASTYSADAVTSVAIVAWCNC